MTTVGRTPLRVAVVGCGQIADAHLGELAHVDGSVVVATCDSAIDLARQAAARFNVPAAFESMTAMLAAASPDVVHITTPPHTHAPLALEAIAAGAHVYVEKPFAIDASEARAVLDAAAVRGRSVCVGHDQLFDLAWLDVRRRVAAGELGEVVHVDSVYGYDLSGPFGALLADEPDHWVHRLPGGLFHNTISHAVYRITDLVPDPSLQARAHWFAVDGRPFPTDLRVMLQGERATASVLFSSRARPVQHVARIYGTRAMAEVNLDAQSVRVERASHARGPFQKLQLTWRQVTESRRAWLTNARRFAQSELHYFGGMRRLFTAFHASIRDGASSPIAPAEIVRVTQVMDDIFLACMSDQLQGASPVRLSLPTSAAGV